MHHRAHFFRLAGQHRERYCGTAISADVCSGEGVKLFRIQGYINLQGCKFGICIDRPSESVEAVAVKPVVEKYEGNRHSKIQ
jgi:hypothetical protein